MSNEGATNAKKGTRRAVRRALYGLAFGLLALSAVLLHQTYSPDLRFWLAQRDLNAQLPALPTFRLEPASAGETRTIDFEGWEENDAAFWRSLKMGDAFARIVSKDARIDAVVLKGASQRQLALGPGWITTTDFPGATGNCGISGHRVTHGHPFRHLDRVKQGDTIDVYSKFRRYRYEVDRILRVTPAHIEVIAHTEEPRLTLTTCDPPGAAVKRLVVQARLVEVIRIDTAR